MVFDINMEDFRRKSCLFTGGNITKTPPTITYASVVSRDKDMDSLTIDALKNLEVKVEDI